MSLPRSTEVAPDDLAERLIRAHHGPPTTGAGVVLADYAEGVRATGWSLRSALVRLAQLDPVRVAAVLQVVRRTDAALKDHVRLLERTAVPTAPELVHRRSDTSPISDGRATDLARALVRYVDAGAAVDAYVGAESVSDEEQRSLDVLVAAVHLDHLAEALAEWAPAPTDPPPLDLLDQVTRGVAAHLDQSGIPREEDRPWPGRR